MALNSTDVDGKDGKGEGKSFASKLKAGRERFLAHVIEHGLEIRRRTPEDFIRHFPPAAIMNGLGEQADLRAQILVLSTGIKHKIAIKKSAESAGEDLQIALDEGETDADSIVALFDPDDRVRYLSDKKLWSYVIEGEFWTVSATKREEFERAKAHIAFMLERALQDRLITHRDVVDGITVNELATRLPKDKLGRIIQQALSSGQKSQPFTEVELMAAMPPVAIVDHVSLDHIWRNVIVPKIAQPHGYADSTGETVKEALSWLGSSGDQAAAGKGGAEAGAEAPEALDATADPAGDAAEAGPTEEAEKDEVEVTDDDIRIS